MAMCPFLCLLKYKHSLYIVCTFLVHPPNLYFFSGLLTQVIRRFQKLVSLQYLPSNTTYFFEVLINAMKKESSLLENSERNSSS